MAMPLVTQPDLEAWVWAQLKDLGGVTCWAYSATQLDRAGWLLAHFVQVDARHKSKALARARAERSRQIMVGLPDQPWTDGTVAYCQPIEGPFWLPDPDGGPRYVARYEVRVHPPRAAALAGSDS